MTRGTFQRIYARPRGACTASLFTPLLSISVACSSSATQIMDELESLPRSIGVEHNPSEVLATEDARPGDRYTWQFSTAVSVEGEAVQIVEFGSLTRTAGTWSLNTEFDEPYTDLEFARWYACEDALLTAEQPCTDPLNWSASDLLIAGKTRWFYMGLTESGERVAGWEDVEFKARLAD